MQKLFPPSSSFKPKKKRGTSPFTCHDVENRFFDIYKHFGSQMGGLH